MLTYLSSRQRPHRRSHGRPTYDWKPISHWSYTVFHRLRTIRDSMQHHSQANYAEILATDTHAGLGGCRNIDGCHTESRGLLCRAFLVSSCWEVLGVQAMHQNKWADLRTVWVSLSPDSFQGLYTTFQCGTKETNASTVSLCSSAALHLRELLVEYVVPASQV